MDVYRGSLSSTQLNGVLTHFGSKLAAANRFDGMYTQQHLSAVNDQGMFTIFDANLRPMRMDSKDQALENFAHFMQGTTISKYSVDIQNPLRLTDCWLDDPIGSGALEIFKDNTQLTVKQGEELQTLFHPFMQVIYPDHIPVLLSHNQVKEMKKQGDRNPVFRDELQKRKKRSAAIGESWDIAEPQEIVWTSLTVKLRDWALENKYDGFVYKNTEEDKTSDSYVTLKTDSILKCQEQFKFNSDAYLQTVSPIFGDYMQKAKAQASDPFIIGLYWGGYEPTQFWTKVPELKT